MELKNLRTFQAVVDKGNYQRAAEMLGYTQSTITIQIQQLEEELGIPLFEKIGRKMVLTQIGEKALEQARELLMAADKLACIGEEEQVLGGSLRVDIVETLLCYQMQEIIKEFRERAPQVRLIIRNRNCLKITENVKDGTCDIGVCYAVDWNREALQVTPLAVDSEIILVASPAFTQKDFATPHQVKAVSLISDEPDSLFRRQIEGYLQEKDILLDETIELWSTEAIKKCIMANLGFTFLPRFVVAEELKSGKLIELMTPISGIRDPVLCVRNKNRWITPAMHLFMELLEDKLTIK